MTNYDRRLDFSHPRNIDPSVLLLSELEILVAQTRLLEVYLKQAQAGGEFETPRLAEKYKAELTSTALELQEQRSGPRDLAGASTMHASEAGGESAERAELQVSLAAKDGALAQQEQTFRSREGQLNGELDDLRARLSATKTELDRHAAELQQARSEIAALIDEKSRLELLQRQTERLLSAQAEQIRRQVRAEFADLENQLGEKESMLQAAEHKNAQTEKHFAAKISELQLELAEKQLRLQSRHAEIESLKSHISALTEQHRLQQQFADGLAASQAEASQRSRELEEPARSLSEAESTGALELQRLRAEVQEKRALLENRNEELVLVKAEMDLLQEWVTQLEAEAARNEQAALSEREVMRNDFQAHIAFLQAELSQKQWALDDRQATVYGVEHTLSAQIEDLQAQLARKQELLQTHTAGFSIETPELTGAQKKGLQQMDEIVAAAIDAEASFTTSRNGRWRSHWGWKRRWRS